MAKKAHLVTVKYSGTTQTTFAQAQAERRRTFGSYEERLRELERRLSYHEKLAELQAGLNDQSRLSLVCVLEGIKKLEGFVGVSLMPKGTYHGVRFR